jgi:hypothetical protein
LARPHIKSDVAPKFIAGESSCAIKPNASLSVLIDMAKWQIVGGWRPGSYTITVRADNLYIDKYTTLSVMSDPIEIEIKE